MKLLKLLLIVVFVVVGVAATVVPALALWTGTSPAAWPALLPGSSAPDTCVACIPPCDCLPDC